jgi:hypothetical protein
MSRYLVPILFFVPLMLGIVSVRDLQSLVEMS